MCHDCNDNIICKAHITKEYTWGNDEWLLDIEFAKIDPGNNGKISFDEWISLKDKLSIQCEEFLWKRLFYFGNHMADRKSDYHINANDLQYICQTQYAFDSEFDPYERALDKLRLKCDDTWTLKFDHKIE